MLGRDTLCGLLVHLGVPMLRRVASSLVGIKLR
jgi:hypothetical protein